MLTWIKNVITGILSNPLAWIIQVIGAVGGIAVSDTWIGKSLGWLVNIGPIYTPHVLFAGAVFIIGLDWIREGIPERLALYLSLAAPSLAMAIPDDAKLHDKMAGWITDINDWLDRVIGPWLTGDAKGAVMSIIGMMCITFVVLYNEPQLLDKISKRSGRTTTSTVGSSSSSSPIARSSRRARSS